MSESSALTHLHCYLIMCTLHRQIFFTKNVIMVILDAKTTQLCRRRKPATEEHLTCPILRGETESTYFRTGHAIILSPAAS